MNRLITISLESIFSGEVGASHPDILVTMGNVATRIAPAEGKPINGAFYAQNLVTGEEFFSTSFSMGERDSIIAAGFHSFMFIHRIHGASNDMSLGSMLTYKEMFGQKEIAPCGTEWMFKNLFYKTMAEVESLLAKESSLFAN